MNKLVLIRHGISIGNELDVIQGNVDYSLSPRGIRELEKKDYSNLKHITNIYASNLKRAIQTAEIIKKKIKFDKDIKIDNHLREVSAGVLEGHTKEYCQLYYPKEYSVFLQRGDYNSILNADTWQDNQARALIFLSKYLQCDNNNDVIVSHAAFIRVMYNLLNNRYRNTPVDVSNGVINEVDNPMSKLNIVDYPIAKTAIVKKIETYEKKYIVKFKDHALNDGDYFEKDILDFLNKYMTVPSVIAMSDTEYGQTKIMKYLEGIHKFGKLEEKDILNIFEEVSKLNTIVQNYKNKDVPCGDVREDLINSRSSLYTEFAKEELEKLLKDEKFNNYLQQVRKILVHNDLHRSNILIDNDKVNIIDFENMRKYPKDLQLATLICSCFLLENPDIDYRNFIKYSILFEKCDEETVKNLIIYRLLFGLSFFEKRLNGKDFDDSDVEIHKKYIKVLDKISK